MSQFTSDFTQFYKELAANNNRDWFHENKKRYEKSVKIPFENFIRKLIAELKKEDSSFDPEPKNCIFRINRDVRFSNDKTPYKLHSSAIIAKDGKKDHTLPGLYIQMGPEDIRIYGGIYMPDKYQLLQIREYIAANLQLFSEALNDKKFKSVYGELHGDKNKIIPKELKSAAKNQPLIFNKNFYYYSIMSPESITNQNLLEILIEKYNAGRLMKNFLTKALGK